MTDDYEVGYKKPPAKHQFKSGKSGNPKGRPKGRRNFKTDLVEELSAPIEIVEAGQKRVISKQMAVIKRLVQKGIEADPRALNTLVSLSFKHLIDEGAEDNEPLTETDLEILNAYYRERVSAEAKSKQRKTCRPKRKR